MYARSNFSELTYSELELIDTLIIWAQRGQRIWTWCSSGIPPTDKSSRLSMSSEELSTSKFSDLGWSPCTKILFTTFSSDRSEASPILEMLYGGSSRLSLWLLDRFLPKSPLLTLLWSVLFTPALLFGPLLLIAKLSMMFELLFIYAFEFARFWVLIDLRFKVAFKYAIECRWDGSLTSWITNKS